MSIESNGAGFNRRKFLQTTGAAATVPASFFIGGTARAQTPTIINMLACYTGLETGK